VVVGGAEAAFDRAVRAVLGGVDGEGGQGEMFGQQLAQLFTEIGHLVELVGVLLPDPFVHLLCAELLFAERLEICFEGREIEMPDILFHIVHEGGKDTKLKRTP
jgi:hypothetical protein